MLRKTLIGFVAVGLMLGRGIAFDCCCGNSEPTSSCRSCCEEEGLPSKDMGLETSNSVLCGCSHGQVALNADQISGQSSQSFSKLASAAWIPLLPAPWLGEERKPTPFVLSFLSRNGPLDPSRLQILRI